MVSTASKSAAAQVIVVIGLKACVRPVPESNRLTQAGQENGGRSPRVHGLQLPDSRWYSRSVSASHAFISQVSSCASQITSGRASRCRWRTATSSCMASYVVMILLSRYYRDLSRYNHNTIPERKCQALMQRIVANPQWQPPRLLDGMRTSRLIQVRPNIANVPWPAATKTLGDFLHVALSCSWRNAESFSNVFIRKLLAAVEACDFFLHWGHVRLFHIKQ